MNNSKNVIGVIGGSGVYNIDGLINTRWVKVTSQFGNPLMACFLGN